VPVKVPYHLIQAEGVLMIRRHEDGWHLPPIYKLERKDKKLAQALLNNLNGVVPPGEDAKVRA
jgi:hypothetical protein